MLASWMLRRSSTGSKLQRFDSADYFAEHRQGRKPARSASTGREVQVVYETQRWLENRAPGLRKSRHRADIALRMTELSKIGVRPSAAEVLDLFSAEERAEIRGAIPECALDAFCKDMARRFDQAHSLVNGTTKSTAATLGSREPISLSHVA